ncbi:Uncharacterised protein [Vibrio cholerae]|nr:Uncharacterised protein [Vibrio cholerae]
MLATSQCHNLSLLYIGCLLAARFLVRSVLRSLIVKWFHVTGVFSPYWCYRGLRQVVVARYG